MAPVSSKSSLLAHSKIFSQISLCHQGISRSILSLC